MKTERRHELETNTLAHELELWGEKLRPYSGVFIGAVGVLLGLYIVSMLWARSRESRNQAAWDAYEHAISEGDVELKELQRIAAGDEFAGTLMQEWAYIAWADRQVFLAADRYFTDREEANKRLTAVAAIYEQFAEGGTNSEIRNRARLGLARVNEMQGRLDEARRQYNLVEGAMGEYAARRAKSLESKQYKEDAKWLATAELPRRPRPGGPGIPGDRPGFETPQPPVDPKGGLPIDSAKSLEEILGGIGGSSDEGARYGEKDSADGDQAKQSETPARSTSDGSAPTPPDANAPAPGSASDASKAATGDSAKSVEPPAAK